MQTPYKYLELWKVAVVSALSVVLFFLLWEVGEEFLLPDGKHNVIEFKYIARGIAASFVATLVLSSWAIRRAAVERMQHEYEMEAINKKLRKLAITDVVTGVYNHRYFEITLEREWQKMERLDHPLACIMIDLDNFKQVNDRYGHQVGDCVLRDTAQLIQREFREIDIISRYGGEEFIVILAEKPGHMAGLKKTMERIRQSIAAQEITCKDQTIKITASLGGALVPSPQIKSPEELVHAADKAMYCAKQRGKNVCFVVGECVERLK